MKKGMEKELFIGLVILLATILILGPTIKSWADTIKYGADKEACKQSVQLKASMKIAEKDIFNIPLKCSSKHRFINYAKDFEGTKEIIAYDMYDCWDQFGQGKIDFLDNRDFFGDVHCFVCSKITFNETLKGKKIVGFGDFLSTEQIPGLDISYKDFLFPVQNTNIDIYNNMPISDPYYIIYVTDRHSYPRATGGLAGAAGSLGGGMIAGCLLGLKIGGISGTLVLPVVGTVGGVAAGCFGGAVVGSAAWYAVGFYFPTTKYTTSLLLTNSKEAIKICQEK